MIKSYKFRLYLNEQQVSLMKQNGGNSRFVWNKLVEFYHQFNDETSKFPTQTLLQKEIIKLKNAYDFLEVSHSQPLQINALRLSRVISNAFKKETIIKRKQRIALAYQEPDPVKRSKKVKKSLNFAFPKFHKKSDNSDSIYYPQNFKIKKCKIFLAKLGWFNFKKHRKIEGIPKTVSINQDGDKWFLSISCEIDAELPKSKELNESNMVGIDVGIKNFAAFSDGTIIENPRTLKKYQDKINLENQRLSRKKKVEVKLSSGEKINRNSKRREKQLLKLHNLYRKIRNIRKDFLHKLTHHIITTYDGVSLETLGIQEIMKNNASSINRSISDVSWYEFSRQLEYKSEWYGKHFIKINKYEPSTQKCNKCGKLSKLSLDERIYKCECGNVEDRDINASKNIRDEGIKLLSNTAGTAESARRNVLKKTEKREKRMNNIIIQEAPSSRSG